MIALELAHSGMYGGNPENVLKSRIDLVIKSYQYLQYKNDLERTYMELNKCN